MNGHRIHVPFNLHDAFNRLRMKKKTVWVNFTGLGCILKFIHNSLIIFLFTSIYYDVMLRLFQCGFFFIFILSFDFGYSGERPYKCHLPDCGRAFIQLSNLQQHLRNHDAQVERAKNRPFHCNICGKGFATESSLRTHTSKVSLSSILCIQWIHSTYTTQNQWSSYPW